MKGTQPISKEEYYAELSEYEYSTYILKAKDWYARYEINGIAFPWVYTNTQYWLEYQNVASNGGATVYIENDGIGHAYLEVNGTVFSYGRYDGSYSPSSGRYGPIGKGVLLKDSHDYAVERMKKSPTSVYFFSEANADVIYYYMNNLFNSGTPTANGGMHIDTYFLIGNNCSTLTSYALQMGNVDIPIMQTPDAFNVFMRPFEINYFKYEIGPKY